MMRLLCNFAEHSHVHRINACAKMQVSRHLHKVWDRFTAACSGGITVFTGSVLFRVIADIAINFM